MIELGGNKYEGGPVSSELPGLGLRFLVIQPPLPDEAAKLLADAVGGIVSNMPEEPAYLKDDEWTKVAIAGSVEENGEIWGKARQIVQEAGGELTPLKGLPQGAEWVQFLTLVSRRTMVFD